MGLENPKQTNDCSFVLFGITYEKVEERKMTALNCKLVVEASSNDSQLE